MAIEDIKRICTIYDNLRNEQYRGAIAYNSDDTLFEHVLANYKTIEPQGLDEAAEEYADHADFGYAECNPYYFTVDAFKAGAKWMEEKIITFLKSEACFGWIEDIPVDNLIARFHNYIK